MYHMSTVEPRFSGLLDNLDIKVLLVRSMKDINSKSVELRK